MQTRMQSMLEQISSVGFGFVVSLIYWSLAIVPQIEGHEITFWLNLSITLQFTVLSLVRGYMFRRMFNAWSMKHRKNILI